MIVEPRQTTATAAEPFTLRCQLNGATVEKALDPTQSLYEALREELKLTGTKGACLEGECGSCTVVVDGKIVNSCLMMAGQAQGRALTTVEGLAADGQLHPVQEAFVAAGAVQCGFCTPGLLIATKALLEANPNPNDEQIRAGLEGNVCRCTGYGKIIQAVHQAAACMAEKSCASNNGGCQ